MRQDLTLLGRQFCLGLVVLALSLSGTSARAAEGGEPSYLPLILIDYTWSPPGFGSVTGTVMDALFNAPVAEASVCLNTENCVLTDANGKYTLTDVASGSQTITALKDSYVTLSDQVKVIAGNQVKLNFFISPDLSQGNVDFRIVLTWDERLVWDGNEIYPNGIPNDLDVHLFLRGSGQVIQIYGDNDGDCTIFPYACMKQDVTNGSGPETVDIPQIELGYIYYFGVLNVNQYLGAPTIPNTKAVARLYNKSGGYREFKVPSSPSDQAKDFWFLFELNGSDGTLSEKNCLIGYIDSLSWTPTCD